MRCFIKALACGLFFCLATFGLLVYADEPYHGRVIDAETKQPIEGAAVVAIWRERAPGIAEAITTYHDVQETITDQQGNFTIPGILGIPTVATAKIQESEFIIFQPGYEAYGGWSLKAKRLPGSIKLYEKDGQTVIELGRLNSGDTILIFKRSFRRRFPF